MSNRLGLLFTIVVAILLACSGVVLAQSTQPDSGQTAKGEELVADASSLNAGDPIPGSYIVVLDDSVSDPTAVANELVGSLNSDIEVTQTYENALKGFAIRAPNLRLSDLSAAASAITGVDFVARDRAVKATAQKTPTGIDRIEADQSSTNAGNGSGAVDEDIAIIDTGIYKHKDLNRVGGYNCTGSDTSAYSDGNGHGTHVAGTAAAKDNDSGVVGVAPGARLWAVKVLNKNGSGSTSSVICGIDWVTGKAGTIKVANMSLGSGPYTTNNADDGNCGRTNNDAEHRAICGSVGAGVFYAVAAGNSNDDLSRYRPAAYDEVLAVTAMSDSDGEPGGTGGVPNCRSDNTDDTAASFSNYTTTVGSDDDHTIAAPGVCITSTWRGNRKHKSGTYKTISGTSMASPHVAGTAALCIAHGDCSGGPANIMSKLRSDAQQHSDLTTTPYYGFTGDPKTAPAGPYYGYLEYAGGY